MAIIGTKQTGKIDLGQNGRVVNWGVAAFSTTDASVAVPVDMLKCDLFLAIPSAAPATDEGLYVETNAAGLVPVAANKVTVKRTGASPTSALPFFWIAFGS